MNKKDEQTLPQTFQSLEEFYPFYLSQHSYNLCRLLHYIGTLIASFCIILAFLSHYLPYIIMGLIYGYGFAWIGHFFVEKNRPATFKYPLFSLACDYIMLYHFLTGQICQQFNKYNLNNRKIIPFDLI